MYAPSEIRKLDLAMDTDKDVFRFDVPVHNVFLVETLERCRHLRNILSRSPFWKSIGLAKVLVKFTFASILEDEEYTLVVVEMAVYSQDVRVSQIALYLNLPAHLFLHLSQLKFTLMEDFESADEACGPLPSKINTTKFPLSKRPSDFKHAQVPLS